MISLKGKGIFRGSNLACCCYLVNKSGFTSFRIKLYQNLQTGYFIGEDVIKKVPVILFITQQTKKKGKLVDTSNYSRKPNCAFTTEKKESYFSLSL